MAIKLETNLPVLCLLGVLLFSPGAFAMDDGILAIVNDELITLNDLREYTHATYVELVAEGIPDEKLKKIMLDLEINGIDQLIQEKLILSKANKIGLEVNAKLVDDRVEEIKKKYPSEQIFMQALVKNGATLTDLRNKILNQLKVKYVIDHEIKSKVYINPQEVTKYYEENIEKFKKREAVDLDSVFVGIKTTKQDAEQKANEALSAINNGEDFKEVAKRYSDTPALGLVEKGQLLPEIENTVFSMAEGQISGPVFVKNGFYIFKLLQKLPPQTAALGEVKDDIQRYLFNMKFTKLLDEWVKKLKEDAYIDIKKQ